MPISEFAFVVANLFLAAKNKGPMDKDHLILKRAALSRPSGMEQRDFDALVVFVPKLHKNPLRKTSHDIGHMIDQTTALP